MGKNGWLGAAAAGAGAAAVGALTAKGPGRALDRRLYHAINRGRGPRADAFFKGITEFGSIWAAVGATIALSRMGRRRAALDALGAAVAMWGVGQLAKKAVMRPRPYDAEGEHRLLIKEPRGTSWPSSHPGVLLTYLLVVTRNLGTPAPIRGALMGLARAVGVSRVYVGVHYPADVVSGMLLGRAVADAWSSAVSPLFLKGLGSGSSGGAPGTVVA